MKEDITTAALEMGRRARAAAAQLRALSTDAKNSALYAAADAIAVAQQRILEANLRDVAAANRNELSAAMIDRLRLDEDRIEAIVNAVRDIAGLPDPVGEIIETTRRPNGLAIDRVRTPIGVVAMIYESRPNVTVDAAALCLKAGNAVILRGGSEALETSLALHEAFITAIAAADITPDAVQIVSSTNRDYVGAILSGLDGAVDLIIPRGGRSLVARVQTEARAPVLGHLEGVCHVYIDGGAERAKAIDILLNAKMRRTGVCGAAETVLIDREAAPRLWPALSAALHEAGCEVRADEELRRKEPHAKPATEDDWRTEYLAPVIAARVVDGVEGALAHIARYGTGHTETIVTEDPDAAARFLENCDSAIVMHNASTQFADGGEFGLGAEIGIATGRLHARGPVGVRELTTYKYVVRGDGQVRP